LSCLSVVPVFILTSCFIAAALLFVLLGFVCIVILGILGPELIQEPFHKSVRILEASLSLSIPSILRPQLLRFSADEVIYLIMEGAEQLGKLSNIH